MGIYQPQKTQAMPTNFAAEKPERKKRSLRRPKQRLEDNIKMDLRETGYDDVVWIHMSLHFSPCDCHFM